MCWPAAHASAEPQEYVLRERLSGVAQRGPPRERGGAGAQRPHTPHDARVPARVVQIAVEVTRRRRPAAEPPRGGLKLLHPPSLVGGPFGRPQKDAHEERIPGAPQRRVPQASTLPRWQPAGDSFKTCPRSVSRDESEKKMGSISPFQLGNAPTRVLRACCARSTRAPTGALPDRHVFLPGLPAASMLSRFSTRCFFVFPLLQARPTSPYSLSRPRPRSRSRSPSRLWGSHLRWLPHDEEDEDW